MRPSGKLSKTFSSVASDVLARGRAVLIFPLGLHQDAERMQACLVLAADGDLQLFMAQLDLARREWRWLYSGHFVDRRGDVVGWLRNANGGPWKPRTTMQPLMSPISSAVVGSLVGPVMVRAARPVTAWSALSWTEFLDDEGGSVA